MARVGESNAVVNFSGELTAAMMEHEARISEAAASGVPAGFDGSSEL
jgi:hypothetical protein